MHQQLCRPATPLTFQRHRNDKTGFSSTLAKYALWPALPQTRKHVFGTASYFNRSIRNEFLHSVLMRWEYSFRPWAWLYVAKQCSRYSRPSLSTGSEQHLLCTLRFETIHSTNFAKEKLFVCNFWVEMRQPHKSCVEIFTPQNWRERTGYSTKYALKHPCTANYALEPTAKPQVSDF